jgi:TnpA family transposase
MVTADTTMLQETSLPFRRRPPAFVLPTDPSEEELAQHWTLSPRDKAEVLQCRGDAQRRRFAVQLCTLRTYGRFLPKAVPAPVAITNYLARQLDLPLVLFGEGPERLATETDHLQRIRTYLGWRPFDEEARTRLTRWLTQRATDDVLPHDLLARAEDILRSWRIVVPAPSTLEELVESVTARVQDEVYTRILSGLPPALLRAMDDLLQVPAGERHSMLFHLKEYPPEASSAVLLRYIARYHFLRDLGVGAIDLHSVSPPLIRYFAEMAKRYDVRALRRFPAAKRAALTACFLVEIHKTILDHIVALHDQLLTKKLREAKNAFEQHYRQLRRQYRRGLATLITLGETFLDPERPPETTLAALRRELGEATVRDAVATCTERQRLEDRGEIDALRARYPGLRRYLPAFFALPFQGEPGSEPLLAGLTLVRQLDAGTQKDLSWLAPTAFMPRKFWPGLANPDGTIDRRTWELGLAVAVRDGLRAGDVYLPESRRHVSFANLVYDPTRWQHERADAYTELQLPQAPDDFCARLQREFDAVAHQAAHGLPRNEFVTVRGDRLHLKRRDALEVPPRLKHLRRTIEGTLPRVRIEDVLMQVDAWCDFTRAFRPPAERVPRIPHFMTTLLATLIAHGTNLGIATMAHSVEDEITADMLQEMSQWCLREDTLKAANAILVNFHHRLPLSAVWGEGTVSSSDGQRFRLQASSLLGALYPRYFGYYDQALTVYTHIADQHSVFHTQVIACSVREAIYVLDGLLANDTILRPKEHFVDQHGYTDQLFGLCHLLGYSLMPRLNVGKQKLYRLDRTTRYGRLDAVLTGTVDLALLREQWDQLVRVAASLRNRTAPAHVVLTRLASSAPSDRLAKALTALGQALKTLYLLRYIQAAPLRGRMQLQINRGEGRHQLARRLFFANQGAFQTGDYEEIMNKATCLSLLSNAVLVWNTVHMMRTIKHLRASGETVTAEELARLSPLAFSHVIPNGTYFSRRTPLEREGNHPEHGPPFDVEMGADL